MPAEHDAILAILDRGFAGDGVTLLAKGSWPKGTNVRPTLVSERDDGVKLWRLSSAQCARWAETMRTRIDLSESPGDLPTLTEGS